MQRSSEMILNVTGTFYLEGPEGVKWDCWDWPNIWVGKWDLIHWDWDWD